MSGFSDLNSILDLEPLEHNLFRGRVPQVGWNRVFGGLVIAQALVAAHKTVDGRDPHSLHAYFLLGGDPAVPIIYEVERIRDGRSFTTRRVVAIQHGRPIFALSCSFHNDEEGFEHQLPMPTVPMPEDLPPLEQVRRDVFPKLPHPVRAYFERDRPIDLRPVDFARYMAGESAQLGNRVWIRARTALPDNPDIHKGVLAYASDLTLLDCALVPHNTSVFDPGIAPASLDHAMWFHRPFRADDWLLYSQESPNANGGRGFSIGHIFRRDGALVATVAQEGLIRRKTPGRDAG